MIARPLGKRWMMVVGLLFLATATPVSAQVPVGWAPELSFHHGKILKHTPKIAYDIPERSLGLMLNWQLHTNGEKAWQRHHRFPALGLAAQYYWLGDREVVGNAWSFLPNISLKILGKERWKLDFTMGTGLAILDRHYDLISNSSNNAIGSSINDITFLCLQLEVQVQAHWRLVAGGSFTHFSNGASQLPNLGINVPALTIGATYQPNLFSPAMDTSFRVPPARRFGAHLSFDLAFKESSTPGGPKQPIYIGAVAGTFKLNEFNHLYLGLGYEYHRSVYNFALHTYAFDTRKEARQGATRWMVFLADEFLFGSLGVMLQAGYYVSPKSVLISKPIYSKLGIRYYLPAVGKPATQFYVGIYLKAHAFTAEYIGLGMGARL